MTDSRAFPGEPTPVGTPVSAHTPGKVVLPPHITECASCDRERTPADNDYTPLQVVLGLPLGWYSGDDGELCPECMTGLMPGAPLNVMGYTDQDAETAIALAIGGASMCWEPRPAGVFDSTTASKIADELVAHLRKLRLLPDPMSDQYPLEPSP